MASGAGSMPGKEPQTLTPGISLLASAPPGRLFHSPLITSENQDKTTHSPPIHMAAPPKLSEPDPATLFATPPESPASP